MTRRFLFGLVIVAALAGAAYAYYINHSVAGPLSGEPVTHDVAGRRPVAVMLDNISSDARPQSGLDRASLVFEALAEGGITRFMAVYLEHDAPTVGPVRSTRLYYNSWAVGLGVIFGHDGGNVDALQQLPSLGTIFNEDADRVSGPFWRISSRAVPHNEYTSTAGLRVYAGQHGGDSGGSRTAIPHKDDAPASQRPASFTLNVQFSSPDYNVAWRYEPAANDFLRSMGGSPHTEGTTGQQLRAKNVIVMYVAESPGSDPYTPGAIRLQTEGTGKAVAYLDGKAITGTWGKPSVDSPLQWLDAGGNPIALNRGTTWIEVVPLGNSVTTSNG